MKNTELLDAALAALAPINTLPDWQQCKARYLGKKSHLTQSLQALKNLPPEERKEHAQALNQTKNALERLFEEHKKKLNLDQLQERLTDQRTDVTRPERCLSELGSLHPIVQVQTRIRQYFGALGFEMEEGPLVEHEAINFTALNTPEHHPARDESDTFYFDEHHLLRTQTSTVQIHGMRQRKAPMRLMSMGPVFRSDFSVRHTPMFHQLEGLIIDPSLHMGHLKRLLTDFLAWFFHQEQALIRFRPSFFPFTEPSAEVDMRCHHCHGQGCRTCSQSGWIELLGCGMVHPNVLKAGGIAPEHHQGLAFGLGLERLAMLYHNLSDIRLLFDNDVAYLKSFGVHTA